MTIYCSRSRKYNSSEHVLNELLLSASLNEQSCNSELRNRISGEVQKNYEPNGFGSV